MNREPPISYEMFYTAYEQAHRWLIRGNDKKNKKASEALIISSILFKSLASLAISDDKQYISTIEIFTNDYMKLNDNLISEFDINEDLTLEDYIINEDYYANIEHLYKETNSEVDEETDSEETFFIRDEESTKTIDELKDSMKKTLDELGFKYSFSAGDGEVIFNSEDARDSVNKRFAYREYEQQVNNKTMFVSYSHNNLEFVDAIESIFDLYGIEIARDNRDIEYKQSIKGFMSRIRETDFSLVILSDEYLKSYNCMYEILEFIKDSNYKNRILPIVLKSAESIFSKEGRIVYIRYWEEQLKNIKSQFQSVDPQNASNVIHEVNKTEEICRNIGEFISLISDMLNYVVESINCEKAVFGIAKYMGLYAPKKTFVVLSYDFESMRNVIVDAIRNEKGLLDGIDCSADMFCINKTSGKMAIKIIVEVDADTSMILFKLRTIFPKDSMIYEM